jgi:hypothetical protein
MTLPTHCLFQARFPVILGQSSSLLLLNLAHIRTISHPLKTVVNQMQVSRIQGLVFSPTPGPCSEEHCTKVQETYHPIRMLNLTTRPHRRRTLMASSRDLSSNETPLQTPTVHVQCPLPTASTTLPRLVERPNMYMSVDESSFDSYPKDDWIKLYLFARNEDVEPVERWEHGIVGQQSHQPYDAQKIYISQFHDRQYPNTTELLSMSAHMSMKQALMDQDNDVPDLNDLPLDERHPGIPSSDSLAGL